MNQELKKYLDKEDSKLLFDFRWGPVSGDEFLKFIKLVREELNYHGNFNFIRMINRETGEVKEVSATEEGYNALNALIEIKHLDDITFEGNKHYADRLTQRLRYLFLRYQ
jgi:hypothetical protein